jgi:glutathione S-transferase
MKMLKLLGRKTSGNVQKVLFGLEEMKLPYEQVDYGRQFGNTLTDDYLKLNPTRKVPTLIDGDLVIWESHTILRYLAAKAKSELYPADPAKRTQVERWMDWMLASLNPVFLLGFRESRKEEAERSKTVGKEISAELAVLDAELAKKEWVAGDFSLADVAIGPIVRRCVAFPFEMHPAQNLQAYVKRLSARPAFTKATAAG